MFISTHKAFTFWVGNIIAANASAHTFAVSGISVHYSVDWRAMLCGCLAAATASHVCLCAGCCCPSKKRELIAPTASRSDRDKSLRARRRGAHSIIGGAMVYTKLCHNRGPFVSIVSDSSVCVRCTLRPSRRPGAQREVSDLNLRFGFGCAIRFVCRDAAMLIMMMMKPAGRRRFDVVLCVYLVRFVIVIRERAPFQFHHPPHH